MTLTRWAEANMTFPLAEDGSWAERHGVSFDAPPRPALFLDRDGVVIDEVPYLHKPQDVRLVAGTLDAMRQATSAGMPVVLVTNQGGIGLGKYGWADFKVVQNHIADLLAAHGLAFNATMASPYHPRGTAPHHLGDHPSRKPNPGMLFRAAQMLPINLAKSWIIGDRLSDLTAGKAAGLEGGIHLTSAHKNAKDEAKAAPALAENGFKVVCLDDASKLVGALPWGRRIDDT